MTNEKIKGSGTPADALSHARPPTGVPLAVLASGTFVPKAQLRARLPESGAKAAACRTHRFRSQRSTSRAGRSAGRHDARAARERTVSFRPRAPHSLRLQEVPSQKASFMSEISRRYCHRRGEVKRRRIFFDETGASRRASLLKRRGTRMILWRPIFVIAGLDPAIHAASTSHYGPPGQARW
jgi:hypothetical protein